MGKTKNLIFYSLNGRTRPEPVQGHFMFMFVNNSSSFLLFAGVHHITKYYQNLALASNKYQHQAKTSLFSMDLFPGSQTTPDPELSKIRLHNPIFSGWHGLVRGSPIVCSAPLIISCKIMVQLFWYSLYRYPSPSEEHQTLYTIIIWNNWKTKL